MSMRELRQRIAARVVGRERELDLLLAAVAAGRDVLLEGPPGTSKSTLLGAITAEWGIPLVFVEGNADLTPGRIVGHHNPARVLREDYQEDNFVAGPLVDAMRSGGFLYIEEFNRAPEDTLNTLLTAMAERKIAIPRVGVVQALPTFRVVASMNPYDNVGTTRLSSSIHDRLCRLAIDYQDAEAERAIVRLRTKCEAARLVNDAVAITRATRRHEDITQGSSVRGAIDVALVATQLAELRDVPIPSEPSIDPPRDLPRAYQELVLDAILVGLSARVQMDESTGTTSEHVLRAIWEDHFFLLPAATSGGGGGGGGGGAGLDSPVRRPSSEAKASASATAKPFRPAPKELTEEPALFTRSSGAGAGTLVMVDRNKSATAKGANLPGAMFGGFTDEAGELLALADVTRAEATADATTRRRAQLIARRLAIRPPRRDWRAHRGLGDLTSLRYRGGSDEIDLDRTLDALVEKPFLEDDDIVVRERLQTKRALVLLVDISGSMKGERLRTAAATVGALAGEMARQTMAVVAFWSDAAVLTRFGEPSTATSLLDTLLCITPKGLTNVEFALATAATLLRTVSLRDARVLLLSDCVHNAGPDPRLPAARLPRLDVLLDTTGENDPDLARDLARKGRGRVRAITTYRDVAPALTAIFS